MFRLCYDAAASSDLVEDLEEEDANEGRSNSSTSEGESDTSEEVRATKDETKEVARSLSNETRERLCLKAKPTQSDDITLHPMLNG